RAQSSIAGQNAVHYTLNKAGAGTLDLQGANTFTGGTQINAGDVVLGSNLATGQTGAINQLQADNEVQTLKLFGSNRPGVTSSITGGTFTLSLVMPGGNTVTTGAIAFSSTPATLAGNIQTAINAATALGNINLSSGA